MVGTGRALSEGMGASSEAGVGMRDAGSLERVGRRRLLRDFAALVGKDRGNTVELLLYIGEIDRRKLYLEHACPSMFAFCTKRFRMSEAVAAKRIRAGRAARRFPCILEMVRRGELHLSGVHQLAGHLTEENHREVLRRARYRTMREIEELVAEIAPKADVAALIRAVPVGRGESSGRGLLLSVGGETAGERARVEGQPVGESAGSDGKAVAVGRRDGEAVAVGGDRRGVVTPLSPRRYKLQVTIGQLARDKLAELQNLLSHQIPDGDPAAVVERALDVLLRETKKKKAALTDKPRAGRKNGGGRTRAIPAQIQREVFGRDEGRCAFVDGEGRRCGSAWQVEFHHCVPYGRDGPHTTHNIELRCRAHNQFEAELEYGRELMAMRKRRA